MEKTKNKKLARKILKILMWVILVLVLLFIALYVVRFFNYFKTKKIDDQIAIIHSTRIDMDDVSGKDLPPVPSEEGNKTLQGIDANTNGIRDDVELAIFNKYPNSAKTRAVLLQYALSLQMETIQPVLNEEIATEIIREEGRSFQCVGNFVTEIKNEKSLDDLLKYTDFIEKQQFNTEERLNARNGFLKNVRSYDDLEKEECDIDLSKLID